MAKKTTTQEPKSLLASILADAIKKYELDQASAYQKGVAYDGIDGLRVHIKHTGTGNREYFATLRGRADELQRAEDKHGKESNDYKAASERILAEVLVETVITGITTADGEKLPFDKSSKAEFVEMLCTLPEKMEEIVAFSGQVANYRKSRIEAEAKNSAKS